MGHEVFISYSAEDKLTAEAVCNALESGGVGCWVAPRDVLPGMNWAEGIMSAIHESRLMILVFSSHANASQQVAQELERGVHLGLPIVPVRIEDAEPTGAFEYFIGSRHWLDALTPPFERHLEHLVHTVKELLQSQDESPAEDGGPSRAPARRSRPLRTLGLATATALLLIGVGLWATWPAPLGLLIDVAGVSGPPVNPALPDKPSIAVLPFTNMSGDPAQDYFSDGLTEDIITGLSRFRELAVMARNSSFQYKGKAVDIKEVGRDLGVRYVVEGSVRRDLETIRVTAQLLDTTTGAHLWAETYDRDLSARNIFAVQDEITEQVVGTIADTYGIISRAGLVESKEKRTENLEAYDCVLRAYAYFQLHTPDAHLQARDCLERAVKIEPNYVDAWAHLAYISREEHHHGFNARPGSLDRAVKFARQAIDLDSTNQMAHVSLAMAYYSRHERDPFLAEAERAIALNPNNGRVLGSFGQLMSFAGEWERGVALSRKAVALNPYHPGWFHLTLSSDHYRKGEYEQALAEAQRINLPSLLIMHVSLAAIYGKLGRPSEAQAALADLRELDPNFPEKTLDHLRKNYFSEALVESFMDGLRKAGLKE